MTDLKNGYSTDCSAVGGCNIKELILLDGVQDAGTPGVNTARYQTQRRDDAEPL